MTRSPRSWAVSRGHRPGVDALPRVITCDRHFDRVVETLVSRPALLRTLQGDRAVDKLVDYANNHYWLTPQGPNSLEMFLALGDTNHFDYVHESVRATLFGAVLGTGRGSGASRDLADPAPPMPVPSDIPAALEAFTHAAAAAINSGVDTGDDLPGGIQASQLLLRVRGMLDPAAMTLLFEAPELASLCDPDEFQTAAYTQTTMALTLTRYLSDADYDALTGYWRAALGDGHDFWPHNPR